MARVTVEGCLKQIPNPFELAILGAKRAHQLIKGGTPLVEADNREIVLALREIAAGKQREQRATEALLQMTRNRNEQMNRKCK